MKSNMNELDDVAKQHLISLLREKRAVLMVGAGSSKFVGYPLWDELIEEMGARLAPSLERPKGVPLTDYADKVKDLLRREGQLTDYFNFLERKFEPKPNVRNHGEFHLVLVKSGFCGIITTNYDSVLETAIIEAYTNEDGPFLCELLDLCQKRPYLVFDFLRGLSLGKSLRWVLHIHGHCRNPMQIILTRNDYLEKYGELAFDESGKPLRMVLDTLHRKVIWSLLTMHSLVFVGFSMEDEFFMQMLRVVQADFTLGSDPVHFAVLPYTSNEDRERALRILEKKGVMPVFYHVPEFDDSTYKADHSGLKRLIFELADSAGVSAGSPSVIDLTKKMMER